jgi:opacity protein-like surface antigen
MKKIALTLLLFCAGILSAHAEDLYIEVTNKTGYDIYHLYISNVNSDEWEEDVLDVDVLLDGDTVKVNLSGYKNPSFDIRAEDEEGDTFTVRDVNVKLYDVVITLDDQD